MRPIVTYEGIDEAIKNLRYTSRNSLKSKLINTIREQYHSSGGSVDSVKEIDTDFLVKTLWETGDDPLLIRSKRKNYNSIKSTVNSDLKKLYSDGLNKEGIIINHKNIFDMSEEAKSEMLESFSYGGQGSSQIPLDKITDVLSVINDFISNKESGIEASEKFEQLKELIRDISGKVGISIVSQGEMATGAQPVQGETAGEAVYSVQPQSPFIIEEQESGSVETEDEAFEEIELTDLPEEDLEDADEVEIIEEPDEETLDEVDEFEEVPEDELEEIPEDEVEDEPLDDIEEVPEEELEEISEDEIEEEAIDEIEDEEVEEVDIEEAPEEEVEEEVEEELDEDEVEIIEEPVEEPLDEVDEFEEVSEDELEEISLDELEDVPEEDLEEISEDEIEEEAIDGIKDEEVEEFEEVPEDELEELPEDDAEDELLDDIEDASLDEIDEISEDEAGEESEDVVIASDDLEEVPEDELEEVPEDEIAELLEDDDYTLEEILEDYDATGYLSEEGQEKALILADRFDKMLSDTERYYNRYLLIPGDRFLIVNATSITDKKQGYIELPEFYFGKFPVTNHLFELFTEKTGYVTTAERLGYGTVYKGRFRYITDDKSGRKVLEWNSSLNSEKIEGACWFQPLGPGSTLHGKRNHPVVQVTIEDAMAFAAWTGKRLPTEQEWEAAARTPLGLDYPWGKKPAKDKCNIEASSIGDTTPVDKYQKGANKYEIYDLIGNVMEWTASSESKERDTLFVAKGGSWVSGENITLTARSLIDPKSPSNILGFRCIAYNK